MPNRMIRDGLLTSWRYERLSSDGKLFFYHVMLCADDLGCIELGPTYLRRRVLFSQDSDERIAKLISELADVDLLRPYQTNRTCYGFIPNFRQRVQVKYAKYPLPPEALYSDDEDAKEKFKGIKEKLPDPTVVHPVDNGSPRDGQRTVSGKREAVSVKKSKTKTDTTRKRVSFVLPEWLVKDKDVWDAWVDARTKSKKPPTDWAKSLAVTKLETMQADGHNVRRLLADAAFHNWQSFWVPKENA